jgi:hypothetical protein
MIFVFKCFERARLISFDEAKEKRNGEERKRFEDHA